MHFEYVCAGPHDEAPDARLST